MVSSLSTRLWGTCGPALLRRSLHGLLVQVCQQQLRAPLGEGQRGCVPDALGCARDDDDCAGKHAAVWVSRGGMHLQQGGLELLLQHCQALLRSDGGGAGCHAGGLRRGEVGVCMGVCRCAPGHTPSQPHWLYQQHLTPTWDDGVAAHQDLLCQGGRLVWAEVAARSGPEWGAHCSQDLACPSSLHPQPDQGEMKKIRRGAGCDLGVTREWPESIHLGARRRAKEPNDCTELFAV